MNILFVTASRIGDAVLSTSLLAYLKEKYPEAQVTIACGSLAAPLFEDFPLLHRLIVLRRGGFLSHWIDLWKRCLTTSWDLIVDLRGSALAYLLKSRSRVVWRSRPSCSVHVHRVEQLAALMSLSPPHSPTVWIKEPRFQKVLSLFPPKDPFIAIGPSANWKGKEWPLDAFKDLIEWLTSSSGPFPQAPVALFCAPQEKATTQQLKTRLPRQNILDLGGSLTLLETAAFLQRSALYVGNDSGLMHLSAACGTPTIGLFGPSRVEHYAPWGSHTRAVTTREPYEKLIKDHHKQESLMTSLPVEDVQKAILDLLKKEGTSL